MPRVLRVVIEDDTDEQLVQGLRKSLGSLPYVAVVHEELGPAPSEEVARAVEFLMGLYPAFYSEEDGAWDRHGGPDDGSPILVTDVEDLGEEKGFSPDTLRRAREHLGWASFKAKGFQWSPWFTHPSITKDDT